jgi:Protein of unknown function (DUF3060)
MRTFGLLLGSCWVIAFGVADAQAQSNEVTIRGNNATSNLDGQGREFTVPGNHDDVHIRGVCKSIQILGNQNTVRLERVDEIKVTGAQNKVFYQSGATKSEPSVSQLGVQNRVVKVEGQGSSALGSKTQPGNDGSANGGLVLTGDDSNLTRKVNAHQIRVLGDRNRVTLTGSADELIITGKNNSVAIEEVNKVRFLGDNNSVTYKNGPGGQKPEVASVGEHNSIRQSDQ